MVRKPGKSTRPLGATGAAATATRFAAVAMAALVAATAQTACTAESVLPPQGDPIRIGATLSLTGSLATQGTAARNGYLLCQDMVNETGGVLGRPIALLIEDDASSAEQSISLYQNLITEQAVDLILGPYGSTLTAAVAPITEALGKVQITPLAATTSIWEQGYERLFMLLPPAERFLDGIVELAVEAGRTRILILREDALFPRAAGDGAADHARRNGMTVVQEITYPSGTEDFGFVLDAVRDEAVEVVAMAASALDDFITFRRQMGAVGGLEDVWFGTSGAVQEFQTALGPGAEGTFGLSAWEPSLPHPGVETFTERYQEAFGLAPSFHAAGAYGGCRLLVTAIHEAGSLDDDAIRDVLLDLETTTTFGPFAVDARGYQTANQGVFIRWEDGEKRVVWPDSPASDAPGAASPGSAPRAGDVVLITGATDGLGRALALTLGRDGAHVLVHGRNPERGAEVVAEIEATGVGSAHFFQADFTSLAAVAELAAAIRGHTDVLHLLVNNAGVGPGASGDPRTLTPDGEELRFQVNYLASYLLTRELLPLLDAGAPSLILNVTSRNQQALDFDDLTMQGTYSGSLAYGRSKLAQILFTIDQAEALAPRGIHTLAVHPAPAMDTELVRATGGTPQSTVADGLASLEHALQMAFRVPSGTFFFEKEVREPHAQALDSAARTRLREASETRIEAILADRRPPVTGAAVARGRVTTVATAGATAAASANPAGGLHP
jgi:branched-chain amino acid transport system substrate-binding protein